MKPTATITIEDSFKSRKEYNIDVERVPVLAALLYHEDVIVEALTRITDVRLKKKAEIMPDEILDEWNRLRQKINDHEIANGPSMFRESLNSMVGEFRDEVVKSHDELFKHPGVAEAYDQFMLMVKLASEE